jgi:O-antigen ligase
VKLPADLHQLGEVIKEPQGRHVPHPHNVFLETWLELGAIGAILALGIGLAALWQMGFLPPLLQGGAYVLFTVSCTIGASGFDLWQTWLLTSYVFAWAAMVLAMRLPALRPATASEPRV